MFRAFTQWYARLLSWLLVFTVAVLMIPVGMALAVNRIVALAKTPASRSEVPAQRSEIPAQRSAPLSETPTTSDADSEPPTTPIERASTP